MKLAYREYGAADSPALVMLHGLFGSSANLHSIARGLEDRFHIILPDLRNHGKSPHDSDMSYASMADDIAGLLDGLGMQSASLVGHSMGGKAAMWLALNQSERVDRLMVLDIAPVTYKHDFLDILTAMKAVAEQGAADRQCADKIMAEFLPLDGLRQYLLQNLIKQGDDWQWRVNLPALESAMPEIVAFPPAEGLSYAGAAWFVHGSKSDYVRSEYDSLIREFFPLFRKRSVADAGHWVYAEQPKVFTTILSTFLNAV